MKKYRHIFSVLLILSITVPFFSAYIFLHVQKKQVRREIKRAMIAKIDPSELVLLKFTKKESREQLRWEHAKEFEYKGEMYDIVNKTELGDSIFYWCWWDYEETKLNKKLDHLLSVFLGQDPKHQQRQHLVIDFLKHLFYAECMHWDMVMSILQIHPAGFRTTCFKDITLIQNDPPPEHLSFFTI